MKKLLVICAILFAAVGFCQDNREAFTEAQRAELVRRLRVARYPTEEIARLAEEFDRLVEEFDRLAEEIRDNGKIEDNTLRTEKIARLKEVGARLEEVGARLKKEREEERKKGRKRVWWSLGPLIGIILIYLISLFLQKCG